MENGQGDIYDDPTIAEQAKIIQGKLKDKKAKVDRSGKKFDSANYEKEKQRVQKPDGEGN